MSERLLPNGFCWCGCGREVGLGKFFAPGHDKQAEAAYMAVYHQGSVAQLLADTDHGPDDEVSIRDAALKHGGWETCPRGCGYAGAAASVRNHLKKHSEKED
ncbi:hypothetical protein K378_01476 [Streptomyces sp. Amel2xB2]|uniref:hypothetical protein n=1 Tax=Streptomyces sp. Amel2xB2 TaxID=1305829 RepID=UPI000DC02708|nr:hypothetical protein [Streptomyces sp. Amel2xB2]RAJ70311.1 hypothetical protein K378_01476 [Streptomyces sp. Amel2xB2]